MLASKFAVVSFLYALDGRRCFKEIIRILEVVSISWLATYDFGRTALSHAPTLQVFC